MRRLPTASPRIRSLLKGFVYRSLPTPVRVQGLSSYATNCWLDLWDKVTGQRDQSVPARRLNISGGGGSFRSIGEHNLKLCRQFGQLEPTDSVFDLGCGMGRTALAMSSFLTPESRYTGLEIIKFAVRWCRSNIGNGHPNFEFVHADVKNASYNPGGAVDACEFVFPFENARFDFCLATSLFTHLLPSDTERYVSEVARVLKPEGRFLSTWFLLDEQTTPYVSAGKAEYTFPFAFEAHAQRREHAPEQAVAYYGSYVRDLFARAGLEIEAFHYGGWSGVPQSIDSGQDVVTARKPG